MYARVLLRGYVHQPTILESFNNWFKFSRNLLACSWWTSSVSPGISKENSTRVPFSAKLLDALYFASNDASLPFTFTSSIFSVFQHDHTLDRGSILRGKGYESGRMYVKIRLRTRIWVLTQVCPLCPLQLARYVLVKRMDVIPCFRFINDNRQTIAVVCFEMKWRRRVRDRIDTLTTSSNAPAYKNVQVKKPETEVSCMKSHDTLEVSSTTFNPGLPLLRTSQTTFLSDHSFPLT